ncbi:MAG: four helix bundle protein [Nitrospirae bacterium]|nr:four helix bundle protein [Nitrospirota bacterium]
MRTNTYKDLVVYQKAYELALSTYKTTKGFPEMEKYGLTSQLRRCSVSIPSNIAEGYRRGRKEYIQFLKIAFGSCAEYETQLSISNDIGYLETLEFQKLYSLQEEVSKLLNAMIKGMEK